MMKKLLMAVLMILSLYQVNAQKIVGYLPSYRDPSTSNIQYAKLNTIIYAFINCNTNGTLITTTGGGAAWDFSMTHFLTVKANCNTYGTKLSISLGGADAGNLRSSRLNSVCGNATYRASLVSDLVNFATTHNLYGIDVDWEFPKTTAEKNNHEALLSDLRTAINASSNPNIKIGVAVGGEYSGGINHLNYFNNNAVQYVDDFHLMTYDFPATYDANNHSTETDAQNSFNAWNSTKGVPKSKMYIGVPFYGRNPARTLESEYNVFSVGAASFNVDNYSGYYYNGKTTLENKATWVMGQGGQGIMIWDLGQDRTDAYSLLSVLYTKMSTICPAPQPNLGPDVGFCTGSVTLDPSIAQAAGRTFSWKQNGSYVVTNSLTANTYNTSTGGAFIVEVTQGGCTKSDQIVVTSGSSLGVTNATRCGPGSVTLSVNTAGGPFDWYAASTGGAVLNTGANYTFNETTSKTYYVQENTGSSTYSGGKAVINPPDAWAEDGYLPANSLPRWAHKIVVSTDLTIQSVKIWTSNNTTNGVKIMIMKADGSTIHDQTAAVNLPTGGGPYTLTVNKTLVAGTYFVGVYAPVGPSYTSTSIWLDHVSNVPTSQSGVFSIEGLCYGNFGTGFAAAQTPSYYGQLFDWVITTGIVPPCGRTPVTTTITIAANTGLTVGSTTPICAGVDGTVTVQSSENNVSYQAFIGASTAGPAITGNAGTLSVSVLNANLSVGGNTITIKGTKTGCGTVSLTNTASITVSSSSAPAITFNNVTKTVGNPAFNLSASSASPGAFTYSLVSSVPASICTVNSAGHVVMTGAGTATLQVDQAASGCYPANSTTATLTINSATATTDAQSGASFSIYPNPFESTSSIHFDLNNSASVKVEVYDITGHKIETLMNGAELSSGTYEIELSNFQAGIYFVKLQIGGYERNIKVVKN
jgi:chitinase